ncbi:MAG: XRE family transcriptional regulator [Pseudomonadota bacterium]
MLEVAEASPTQKEREAVVAKAVVNAGTALGLTQKEIARAIGASEGQISKAKAGKATLTGKPYDLACYLIRVFRSLDAVTGGDGESTRQWMRHHNTDLGAAPALLIASPAGLVDVMNYLDAARAPL